MSSSSRSRLACQAGTATTTLRVATLIATGIWMSSARAVDFYVQPTISAIARTNSNIQLSTDPSDQKQEQGYNVDAEALVSIDTPVWDTTFRPRVEYQYYPNLTVLNRLDALVDLNTSYKTQRGQFFVFGRFDHLAEVNAETPGAQFNDVNPGVPTAATGRVRVGSTQDNAYLQPTYTYKLTQLLSVGVGAVYQSTLYSPEDLQAHVNYNFYEGRAFVGWSYSPLTIITVGAYGSRYDASAIDSTAKSAGGSIELASNWSPVWQTKLTVLDQRTDISATTNGVDKQTVNAWGATFSTIYTTQNSQTRFVVGRAISPNGGGSLYATGQLQVQYDRQLSERLAFTGAARLIDSQGLTSALSGSDRHYARTDLSLKWNLTEVWFIQGGYDYTWQKYKTDTVSARANEVYIAFGYRGLKRQVRN